MKKPNPIFYKVIDTQRGHHGYKYKKGINIDPQGAEDVRTVGSCQPGALYFTDAKNLEKWTDYGNKVAILRPVDRYCKDTGLDSVKWKATSVDVLEIITFKEASIRKLLSRRYMGSVSFKELHKMKLPIKEIVATLIEVDKLREIVDNIKACFKYIPKNRLHNFWYENKFWTYALRHGVYPDRISVLANMSEKDRQWFLKNFPEKASKLIREY